MVTKSSNKKGNPYHDEQGEFTSKHGAGSATAEKIQKLFSAGAGKGQDIKKAFSKKEEKPSVEPPEFGDDVDEFWEAVKNYKEEKEKNLSAKEETPKLEDGGLQPTEEQSESISLMMNDETYKSVINDRTLDSEKIRNATEEELKELLAAKTVLLSKYSNTDLESLNKQTFYYLWAYPIKPSDYIDKKNNIEAKRNYFIDTYQGSDKAEKLAALDKFVEAGKAYEEAKKAFDDKYSVAEKIVEKYRNPAYSIEAKKNAIFVGEKEGLSGDATTDKCRQLFGDQADDLVEYLKKNDSEAYDYLKSYTESFSSINEPLRKEKYLGSKSDFVEQVEAMTRAIDRSEWDFDFYVIRGTYSITDKENGVNITENIKDSDLKDIVGKEFVNHSFYSAGAGSGTGMPHRPILIKTYCPKGVKGFYVDKFSYYPGENEIILQRGYTYRITSAKRQNGQILIEAEVILGSDSSKWNHDQLVEIAKKYISG